MAAEQCDRCGQAPCECDRLAEGYECQDCGYTPTYRELQHGTCRLCRAREAAR